MSTAAVDIAAERKAALERRRLQNADVLLRGRALRVLEMCWNGSKESLMERIHAVYPNMVKGEAHQLLDLVLQVQQTERINILTLSPPPEDTSDSVESAAPQPSTESEIAMPTTEQKAMTGSEMTGKHKKTRRDVNEGRRIMEVIRAELPTRPGLTYQEIQALVSEKLGITLKTQPAKHYRDRALRKFREAMAPATDCAPTTPQESEAEIQAPVTQSEPEAVAAIEEQGLVQLGATEIGVLRFVGVSEDHIGQAVRLANFINSLPASAAQAGASSLTR